MKYHSTRCKENLLNSSDAIVMGICEDGGLFVPQSFPTLDVKLLLNKPYSYIAAKVLSLYLTDYSNEFIEKTVTKVYSEKRFANGAGHVARINERLNFLELWHGPTYAFKDYALQLLPHLLTEAKKITNNENEHLILVATSGDTGSAALYGFANVTGTKVAVMYPDGGVSLVQERQMIEADGDNLNVYAVKGNFDDIQTAVKVLFSDESLAQFAAEHNVSLSSANSINLGRLLPQICYYFSSYAELLADGTIKSEEVVDYVVPTGNFGDILAGYYAKQMGLPVGKLICASNKNRILTDFFTTGVYDANREFYLTGSPSMDILISSNLERLLYHESGDPQYVASLIDNLKKTGKFEINKDLLVKLQQTFYADSADDEITRKTVLNYEKEYNYICDPHTGVALYAAKSWSNTGNASNQIIVLSTASPYKFPSELIASLSKTRLRDDTCINLLENAYPWLPIPENILNMRNPSLAKQETLTIDDLKNKVMDLIKEG